jgi:MFS family permease
MATAGKWFRKKLSLATGLIVSGGGAGGLLLPLITRVIDIFGWQTSMLIMGLFLLVIISPLSLLIRQSPEQYGYIPDGDVYEGTGLIENHAPVQGNEVYTGVRQFLKNSIFWRISLAYAFHALVWYAVQVHIMPYLSTVGIARIASSYVASALTIVSIFGRLCFGWLGDRFNKKWVATSGAILISVSLLLFSYIGVLAIWVLVPAIIMFGIGMGGPLTLHSVLLKEYFGTSNLGAIIGFSVGTTLIGMMAGPPLASWLFEIYGSYHIAWLALIGVSIICGAVLLSNPPVDTIKQRSGSGTDGI